MSEMLKDAVAMLRQLPVELARRADGWTMRQHAPVDIAGDGSVAWCTRCKKEWPCEPFIAADARVRDTEETT